MLLLLGLILLGSGLFLMHSGDTENEQQSRRYLPLMVVGAVILLIIGGAGYTLSGTDEERSEGAPQQPGQAFPQPPQYQQTNTPTFTPAQQTTPAFPGPTPASSGIPAQPDGSWICPQCSSKVEGKYIFCTNCGFKRGN